MHKENIIFPFSDLNNDSKYSVLLAAAALVESVGEFAV